MLHSPFYFWEYIMTDGSLLLSVIREIEMGQEAYLFLWYCQCISLNWSLTEKAFLTTPIQAEQSSCLIFQKCLQLSLGTEWASAQNLFKINHFGDFFFLPKVTQISWAIQIWCQVKIWQSITSMKPFPQEREDARSSIHCDLNQSILYILIHR